MLFLKKIVAWPISRLFYHVAYSLENYPEFDRTVDWMVSVSMFFQDWGDLYGPWTSVGDPYRRLHKDQDML